MANLNKIQKYLTPQKIEDFIDNNFSHLDIYKKAADELGLDPSTRLGDIEEVKKAIGMAQSNKNFPDLKNIIEQANLDKNVFTVKKYEIKTWQNSGQKWLHSLNAVYENGLEPEVINKFKQTLLDDIKKASKPVNKIQVRKNTELLYLLGISDLHFGKCALNLEPFGATQRRFESSIAYLLEQVKEKKIDKIIIICGSDAFNIDNSNSTTTAGTPQLSGKSWEQLFKEVRVIMTKAVERCLEVCPVHIIKCPGNHDQETSVSLAHVLDAYFYNNENVTVDLSETSRQYFHWGTNLLGFVHGQSEKIDTLGNLMALEKPKEWAQSSQKFFILGHRHKKSQRIFQSDDENFGVRTKILPSLSSEDHWHSKNGLVGNTKSAEGLLFSKKHGLVATFEKNFLT